MDMEQYFQDGLVQDDFVQDTKSSLEKWNSVSDTVKDLDNNSSGGFDCNICLESVNDPVVTLCGHLYCWPCIYKWLHFQSVSSQNKDQQSQQCPVCKAEVSQTSLVPLYGKGQNKKSCKSKAPNLGIVIPRRPVGPACGFDSPIATSTTPHTSHQLHYRNYYHQPQLNHPNRGGYAASPMISPGGTTTFGVFGEMIYGRVFGNSITNVYTYPNSYELAGISSPRLRRRVMQADRSLNRLCFFLFCCVVLCLLSF